MNLLYGTPQGMAEMAIALCIRHYARANPPGPHELRTVSEPGSQCGEAWGLHLGEPASDLGSQARQATPANIFASFYHFFYRT